MPSSSYLLFQFHKGTIRTPCCYIITLATSNFNSIKVQLEPEVCCTRLDSDSIFQFHKGTIRTSFNLCTLRLRFTYFNSIKVQLERLYEIRFHIKLRYFNSIKVQLELPSSQHRHKVQQNFNSIKVQLEHCSQQCNSEG